MPALKYDEQQRETGCFQLTKVDKDVIDARFTLQSNLINGATNLKIDHLLNRRLLEIPCQGWVVQGHVFCGTEDNNFCRHTTGVGYSQTTSMTASGWLAELLEHAFLYMGRSEVLEHQSKPSFQNLSRRVIFF
jgi:hypothetical protein